MRNHGCGDERKIGGVPVWLPSPPPACIEIIDDDCSCDDWRDERSCRRSRRLFCRPCCTPCSAPCSPPCPPAGHPSLPPPAFPPPPFPLDRMVEFCLCVGSICEITCVEVEVECVKVFQRDCNNCLWLELCVTLRYRDRFCNLCTQQQSVSVECCDVPWSCSCCPPRVQVCGPPCATVGEGQVHISAPIRIC